MVSSWSYLHRRPSYYPKGINMKNLAGITTCDRDIMNELNESGIPVVLSDPHSGEVPYTIEGQLGEFKFTRRWTNWQVTGRVPIDVAKELFKNPIGEKYVRVVGDCMGPQPEMYASWFTADGHGVRPLSEKSSTENTLKYLTPGSSGAKFLGSLVFSDDPKSIGAQQYVTSYHIDTQEGLNLFAQTLRAHGLVSAGSS